MKSRSRRTASTFKHKQDSAKAARAGAVLKEVRSLRLDGRDSARKVHDEVRGYFENHVHRMASLTYRAKGWAIGSGPIESACKTVIDKQMKNGGMRWGGDGADEMCHLRALFNSGEDH